MDIILIAKYLGMASAIVGACSVLWLKVLKPFGLFFTGLYSQWNRMVTELTPNGGSSMKDALGRIETRQLIEVQVRKALNNDAIFGIWEADTDGKCTYALKGFVGQLVISDQTDDVFFSNGD